MTLSQLMDGRTPNPAYEGWVTGDDMVLAVDCGETAAEELTAAAAAGFAVAGMGVTGLDGSLNPITQEKTYLRAGQCTVKTGTQRTFTVSADRYVGDAFQDFVLSHAVKYGTGSAVVRRYLYFNVLTGRGETGLCTLVVRSDGSGEAGEAAGVEIELRAEGGTPTEYTYAAA